MNASLFRTKFNVHPFTDVARCQMKCQMKKKIVHRINVSGTDIITGEFITTDEYNAENVIEMEVARWFLGSFIVSISSQKYIRKQR